MEQKSNLTQRKLITRKKIDLTATLDQLEQGESITIKAIYAKSNTIRTTVVRLEKKTKKKFQVTEAGLQDETLIIRLK